MKTVLNVKTDTDVKERAQALARHIGVPLSTVVNAYLKEFVHTGTLTISRDPALKQSVARRLEKHVLEAQNGKNLSPAFSSTDDAVKYLRSL
jgi:antitoxin component of RelBE/YafQ-DinJ toxin-antitoxin module